MKSDQDLVHTLSRLPKDSLSARDKTEIHQFVQQSINGAIPVSNVEKSFPRLATAVIGSIVAGLVLITVGALAIKQDSHDRYGKTAKQHKPAPILDLHAVQSSPILMGLQMFPNGNGWLNDAPGGTLLHTTDGGLHWRSIREIAGQQSTEIVTALDSDVAWLAEGTTRNLSTSITIYKTVNGGTHWKALTMLQRLPGNASGQLPAYLSFIDQKHGWMVTHIPNYGLGGTSPGALYYTTDGGITWSLAATNVKQEFINFRWVDFTTPSIGYTVGSLQSQSTDGGASIDSAEGFFITHDGGKTWRSISLQLPRGSTILRPTFTTDKTGVLPVTVTNNATSRLIMFRTVNGGTTWVKMGTKSVTGTPTVSMYTARDGYMLNGSSLYRTSDFGGHWTQVGLVPGTIRNYYISMDFQNEKLGWCYAWPDPFIEPNAKSVFLFRTSDAGHVWTQVPIS